MAKAIARRKAKSMTVPLAVVAGFAPLISDTIIQARANGIAEVPHVLAWHLAGINTWDNNSFSFSRLMQGWTPIIAGFVAHKLANKIGLNRALANAGVPFVRF